MKSQRTYIKYGGALSTATFYSIIVKPYSCYLLSFQLSTEAELLNMKQRSCSPLRP